MILPFSVLISGYYMAIAKTHAHHLFAFLLHGASIGLIFEYAMTIIRTVIWDVRDMRECSYTEETIADLEMLYEGRTALCLDADDLGIRSMDSRQKRICAKTEEKSSETF